MLKELDQLNQIKTQIQQLQSDLERWLNQASLVEEESKNQIHQLDQEIKSIEQELSETEIQIKELTEQQTKLQNESRLQLEDKNILLQSAENNLASLQTEIAALRNERDSLGLQIGEERAAVGTAASQRESLRQQLSNLQEEFKKMQGFASQDIRSTDILRTYMVLYRKVYATRPHVRALGLLHGPKANWNPDELAKTLAVSESVVDDCLEDLVRAELITWDEKREYVQLQARLF